MSNYEQLVEALWSASTVSTAWEKLMRDAAAAIEALQVDQKKTVTQIFGEEQMAWEGRCKDLMYQIADLQAQLPKQGEWKCSYPEIEPNPMFMYGICSICGFEQSISNKLNYCPNCGAKMNGEQNVE